MAAATSPGVPRRLAAEARRAPLAVIAAAGLVAGIVARLAARAPVAADVIWLGTIAAAGAPLVARTLIGMARGRFAADIVATLAILTSFWLGEYFAGAVIVLMQAGGEGLERYALGRASDSLEALLARAPKIARRLAGGDVITVPVEEIRAGDPLLVRPGDLVPVDVTVVEGRSAVDQSALTGEPEPVSVGPGATLLSGAINLDGALTVRALRPSAESEYQRIVRLVEAARRAKPRLQRIADRWAVWFTPLTLAMCGVAWLVTHSADAVLGVLVVATPCPLILAVPVAVIAAVSRAAERGIIVKSGVAIEQVGRARVVVFDKTGTLTLGRPSVARVAPADSWPAERLLQMAAAVEQRSSHHLGHAVAEAARERGLAPLPATAVRETPGLGVTGAVDGRTVAVGSAAYLRSQGVAVTDGASDRTTAFVAVDGRLAGAVEFADRLRHQVPTLMQRLLMLGVQDTVMLTGDREVSAEVIARQAGIHTVRANLLPAEKVAVVNDLKAAVRHGAVVMVGDGINDAPALAAASVGVALGAYGSAAPAEAADIVVLVDDVSRVADAVAIGQRMRRIALQSVGLGLGASVILMGIASLGHISPPVGAILQEALDAAVILNALRARG